CPVIFKVRDGSYNEQIKLFQVLGSSATNFIRFEGESGDSSLAELHYQENNPSNDFTLSLTGTDYITFRDLGIRRSNGSGNLFIQNNAHHVTVENCWLGHVVSPNSSCDSMLTFRNNQMQDYNLTLSNSTRAKGIVIENNEAGSIIINNSSDVNIDNNNFGYLSLSNSDICEIKNNSGWTWANDSFAYRITINNCREILSRDNLFYVHETNEDTLLDVYSNRTPVYGDDWGFISRDCRKMKIHNNEIYNSYGIYNLRGDSIEVKRNYTKNSFLDRGYGLYFEGIGNSLVVDSNDVNDPKEFGIVCRPYGSVTWKVRENIIKGAGDNGVLIEWGSGGEYIDNRILGMRYGTGFVINNANVLVANNYVQSTGLGIAKGISLRSGASGSRIVFNSVNITGTDVENGVALEVLGGNNYVVKNNIFANNG
ncbi:MAG: NosD domain-containing protein, partial [Bacteroidia bacterium]